MSRVSECRDCDELISFIQGSNGRWIPVEPGTENRHRCKLEQRCESCGETFQGANWMKTCPKCYRSGRTAQNPVQEPPTPARDPERLREADDVDEDIPPF